MTKSSAPPELPAERDASGVSIATGVGAGLAEPTVCNPCWRADCAPAWQADIASVRCPACGLVGPWVREEQGVRAWNDFIETQIERHFKYNAAEAFYKEQHFGMRLRYHEEYRDMNAEAPHPQQEKTTSTT